MSAPELQRPIEALLFVAGEALSIPQLAKLLDVEPARCAALEDSLTGIASAEAAGCAVIAVPGVAPVPARPGRVIVGSLREVDLDRLRRAVAGHAHPAVTNES